MRQTDTSSETKILFLGEGELKAISSQWLGLDINLYVGPVAEIELSHLAGPSQK